MYLNSMLRIQYSKSIFFMFGYFGPQDKGPLASEVPKCWALEGSRILKSIWTPQACNILAHSHYKLPKKGYSVTYSLGVLVGPWGARHLWYLGSATKLLKMFGLMMKPGPASTQSKLVSWTRTVPRSSNAVPFWAVYSNPQEENRP